MVQCLKGINTDLLADPAFPAGSRIRRLLAEVHYEWVGLDRRIEALDQEFIDLARDNEVARRLVSIPRIGVLNASALVAVVGDGATFANVRYLGALLGLILPGTRR